MSPLPDSTFAPEPARGALPAWAGWRVPSKALYALAALVLAGIALRIVAGAAAWPVLPTLVDSWPYAYYAESGLLENPQHPAGYSFVLAVVGTVTHSVGAFVALQHLAGIASALVLFAAVRRLCGSPWPGVVGAAVILLGSDQVYLESTIMSETLFTLLLACTLYAVARMLERPQLWWPWPAIAGTLVAVTGMTRTAGLFLLPVLLLALLLSRPRPWLARWRPAAAMLGTACALLLAYATANAIDHDRFEVGPTPGWHLYARVAPVADCSQFTPPRETAALCETSAVEDRLGPDYYLYDPKSPASRLYGQIGVVRGEGDGPLGEFARRAVLAQPSAYLDAVFTDIAGYFFSDGYEWTPGRGADLDGQVSWDWALNPDKGQVLTERGMESFFRPFSVDRNRGLLELLLDYQGIFRFGATLLTIATLLTLIGLFVGPGRARIAVLILGVGGLAMIVLPTFSAIYVGRYTVPPAGLLASAAAIAGMSIAPHLQRGARRLRLRS